MIWARLIVDNAFTLQKTTSENTKQAHLSHPSKSHLDVVSVKVVGASKSSFLLETRPPFLHCEPPARQTTSGFVPNKPLQCEFASSRSFMSVSCFTSLDCRCRKDEVKRKSSMLNQVPLYLEMNYCEVLMTNFDSWRLAFTAANFIWFHTKSCIRKTFGESVENNLKVCTQCIAQFVELAQKVFSRKCETEVCGAHQFNLKFKSVQRAPI